MAAYLDKDIIFLYDFSLQQHYTKYTNPDQPSRFQPQGDMPPPLPPLPLEYFSETSSEGIDLGKYGLK